MIAVTIGTAGGHHRPERPAPRSARRHDTDDLGISLDGRSRSLRGTAPFISTVSPAARASASGLVERIGIPHRIALVMGTSL